MTKIRFFDLHGNIGYAKNPLVIPIDVMGEEGFGVLHSGVTITPKSTTKYIKPRFFSEEVADLLVENEIKRKLADEKVKQMLSGKEYAKLGGLALGGAAAAGGAAYALPAISAYIAPTTIGGNIVGDMAGGLALGTAMEEGQRAAFGLSAGDILYKLVKPYLGDSAVGDFAANMARPEYWVSPSMLFKGTFNAALNTLGKLFERNISTPRAKEPLKSVQYSLTPSSQVSSDRISRIKKIASAIPDAYTQEALYMPNSELSTLSKEYKFTPMYEGNIGEFNKKFDKEILDRLLEMGINLDSKIFVTSNNDVGRILTTPREFMKNSPDYVYYGLFEDSSSWKGLHFPHNGLVMVDPTFGKGFSTAMHEVNGHRRFPLIEALIDKGAMKPYSDVMDTLNDGIRNSTINSLSINELRATLLEVLRDIMYPIYKNNNKPSDAFNIGRLVLIPRIKLENTLTNHLLGQDAVAMFKQYGGMKIPEGSINGELLRRYVLEARIRYGLVGNKNITDEEIALSLYKHAAELGEGSAAVNILGEPLLLFRGDTRRYSELKPRITPDELVKAGGTMDNSLGTLFLGLMPERIGGLERYIVGIRDFRGTKKLMGSGTGSRVKTPNGDIVKEYINDEIAVIPEGSYLLFSYPSRYGNTSFYKLPASWSESGVNDINAFVVRTPNMRDATKEISVLNDDFLVKGGPKVNYYGPVVDEGATGIAGSSERDAMAKHYKLVLNKAEESLLGLLKSNKDSYLRDEHSNYDYFALPNFNIRGAKHLLPYDLRIPRNWNDPNIYKALIPIGGTAYGIDVENKK